MELDDFVNRLCQRILLYIESGEKPGKLIDFVPPDSLSKTSDLHLPLEGRGTEA